MSYLRPHRLEDALEWLAAERPLVMAGCTDIYPLHQTPALDGPLLDITALAELRGISAGGWLAPLRRGDKLDRYAAGRAAGGL